LDLMLGVEVLLMEAVAEVLVKDVAVFDWVFTGWVVSIVPLYWKL